MSPYDDLLLWLSERREGGIASLRDACAWAAGLARPGLRGQDVLDDLLALGHVEVQEGRWAVTPSCLAVLADGGGNAVLVGARPRWLVEALAALDTAQDPALRELADDLYDHGLVAQEGPSTWYINVGPTASLSALRSLGVEVLTCPAEALLQRAHFERQRAPLVRSVRPGEPAGRLRLDGPTLSSVTWEPQDDHHQGTYRYLRNNQVVYAQRRSDGWLELDFRTAVWATVRRGAWCIWYSPRARCLSLPSAVRPPLDVERALVLRTGRLPSRGPRPAVTGTGAVVTTYCNITLALAEQVAALLEKEVTLV